MKKGLLTIFLLVLVASIFAQDKDLARVNRVQGLEVYIMSEPVRDYDVVCDVSGGIKATSYLTAGLVNASISDKVSQFVHRALKENYRIDAVVYSSGKRIVGIKFKDTATPETKGIARVHKSEGVPVFVMCEPLADYETLSSKGGGVKWKSLATGGIINNSIEEDVDKMAAKVMSPQTQGIICDGGKRATAIQFKS